MNKQIYKKTRYPGIYQNIKHKNYVVDICNKDIRTSISTVDGTKKGAKIMDVDIARKIQQDSSIIKRVTLSINNKDTVNMAFETYLYDAKYNRNLKERTLNQKTGVYHLYIEKKIGNKKLFSITADDILEIKIDIDKRCKEMSSKYSAFKTVKTIFNWLVNQKILDVSPAKDIKQFPKEKIIHTIWSSSQVKSFLDEVKKDFTQEDILKAYRARLIYLLIKLDFIMSARIGETRALQYKKIDFEKSKVLITANMDRRGNIAETTKTNDSKDWIDIPTQLLQEILEYKNWISENFDYEITDETPLFVNFKTGKPYSDSVIREIYKMYAEKLDLPSMPIYNFRHSGATLMMEMNYEMYVIQNRLRHKNIQTTIDTYGTVSNKVKKKLVEDLSKFC